MSIQKVIIFEFAPTADEIWRIPKHHRNGYTHYDAETGLVSILDTDHDAKPRPEIIAIYAGGKATNVARVLDRLLTDEDSLYVELVTFLPPPDGPLRKLRLQLEDEREKRKICLKPSTPAGIYVQCLQVMGMEKIRPCFQVVDGLKESGRMQTTRRCIEVTLQEGCGTLNFSPRIVWSQEAAQAVLAKVAEIARDADLVVMAGSSPTWDAESEDGLTPYSFYAKVIEALSPDCQVSIDTAGRYLRECLLAWRPPRFVFMNTDEFGGVFWEQLEESSFSQTTFLVHDKDGCRVWDRSPPSGPNGKHYPSIPVLTVYSTIGAGDAMHAGFLKEWIREGNLGRSVIYSQVVAAASVSNEKATHGIKAGPINDRFRRLVRERYGDN